VRNGVRPIALVTAAVAALLGLNVTPAAADALAAIPMPTCCVSDTVGYGGNVYALSQQPPGPGLEQATVVRIDPASNTTTGSLTLLAGTPSGNALDTDAMAVAGGSIWVVAYFENEVLRIDPTKMSITAAIPVGRSPSSIVYDGRSLWVALNNAQSVIRIDPVNNRITQTVHVGSKDTSDSPWQIAYDGSQVLASMPNSGRVARIDPGTGRVRYDVVGRDAAACAKLLPVAGGYWLDDTECATTYYRWDARRGRISVVLDPTSDVRHDWGAVVVGSALYTGEFDCADVCTQGLLVKRDSVSGAEIAESTFGIESFLPHFAAGSFWVGDFDDATLQRVAAF
jgi:hypothetical protein